MEELSSDFKPLEGEANFGPTILREVKGGLHLAPECICTEGDDFLMADRPEGLDRHDRGRTVRFPHGLMMFGESIEECAERLVSEQFNKIVDSVRVLRIYSYLDDENHWHFEPLLHLTVSGPDDPPEDVAEFVRFRGARMPEGAVWGEGTFEEVHEQYFKK